jgi:hypothetical protein
MLTKKQGEYEYGLGFLSYVCQQVEKYHEVFKPIRDNIGQKEKKEINGA